MLREKNNGRLPRIMLAAPSSGSGKTLITCGLLQALVNRGIHVISFKCGPDYIDPMFHLKVIGTPSRNLDPFFYRLGNHPVSVCQTGAQGGAVGDGRGHGIL